MRPTRVQHQTRGLRGDNDARTGMPFGIPKGAMCVQRFDDSRKFCNSHYLSHFAAFFIDARTKRSVVESFVFCYYTKGNLGVTVVVKSLWKWGHRRATLQRGGSTLRRSGKTVPPKQRLVCLNRGLGGRAVGDPNSVMILPQVHLRKPCYDFYFL